MGTSSGRLDPLTIGAIFVVVLGSMYAAVLFSEGELFPPDTTDGAEDALRDATWAELNDRRAAEGLDRLPQDRYERGLAQDTVETLVAEHGANATNRPPDERLPNAQIVCTQLPASAPVSGADRNVTAAALADELMAAGDSVLLRPSARFSAALGIVIDDDTAYVVYRSCEQADV